MTDQPGTFELAVLELGRAVGAIASLLTDDATLDTFAQLGVEFPPELLADANFNSARGSIVAAGGLISSQLADLEAAVEGGDATQIISAGAKLATTIGQLITSFDQLVNALQAAEPGLPGITPTQINALVADLPARLLDLLVHDYLLALVPPIGAVFELLGVIERTFVPGDPANPTKPDFDKITLHLDQLLPALTNPVNQLQSLYHWGDGGFDATHLLTVLEGALGSLGLPVLLKPAAGAQPITLEAFALDLKPTSAGSPPGLEVDLVMPASVDRQFTFPISPPVWNATVDAHAAIAMRASGSVRPPLDVEVTPPGGQASASVDVALAAQPPAPLVVFGQAGGSRLEVASVSLGGGVHLTWDTGSGKATGSPDAKGSLTGGKLVVDASQGDGFITTLLGGVHLESTFGVQFAFSPDSGVRFEGSGSLQIEIPTHLSIGPLDVSSIYVVAGIDGKSLPVELSAAMSAQLGPLAASVDRLGAIVTVGFPDGGGNAGPVDIRVAFKPPTGVGLSVNAVIVTGGGFLSIDTQRGEYAGALQLEIAGFLGVSAIGLISTKNPDGSPGFSLLIILTADFGPGIQLGFGFTLNAVGGLLGLNRTMLFQPLMDGVRSGAMDDIMFPRDVIANAPRIISDLRAIFPPQQGTFLVGPMAKLGWGEPTLVSLSLGVIVEVPPGDIAILGVLRLALPTSDAAILVLQVNFAGALEFSKQRLYFFASLYDSHILFITIQGEMGLLVAWGDNANFVVSVGGFHPQFNPPPLPFPSPKRIEIDIINESFARIRADGYFAVTTNTVQFGTHAEYFFGFSALNVQGSSSFDALIQFSPFHFIVSFETSFSVNVFGAGMFGLDIQLMLEGPTPWHAKGSGSISFLFFSVSVPIDITWGDARDTTLPPVAVMPILTGELSKRSNWKAQLPSGSNLLVSLRKLGPSETDLVLHPAGALQVSQRAIPLDVTLDKVGSQKPSDANRFSLKVTSPDLAKDRDLQQQFAPAQFKDASDADKLSEPAYSPQDGGIELAAAAGVYDTGTALTRNVRYDLTIIDTALEPKPLRSRFFEYPGALFAHWLGGSSVALSVLSSDYHSLTHPLDGAVAVAGENYAVAHQADNTLLSAETGAFTSRWAAEEHLQRAVAADPTLAGSVHVLPAFEVAV